MISDSKISEVESIIGVKFINKKLLSQALVHKSFSNDNSANNEILEFLGDRVLGLVLAKKLISLYPNDKEGQLDKRLASLINKKVCAKVLEKYDLIKFISISKAQKKIKTGNIKIFGDLCESLIGAIYIDRGFESAENFIFDLWKDQLKHSSEIKIDAKTKLQELSLKLYKELPKYKDLSTSGPAHKPVFKVSVSIKKSKTFTGEGSSKRNAEQKAAESLLNNLENE
jgi:ribonuclease-3